MIEAFNDVPVRNSGVIYSSALHQIKKMYAVDPEMAGELAISAIEQILTGQISSTEPMIDMLLTPAQAINDSNVLKYEMKKESARAKKVKDMQLEEIADMVKRGVKQREIASQLKLSQQTVSYRLGLIKASYPELLQTNLDFYQNTKIPICTKNENLVILQGDDSFVKSEGDKDDLWSKF